MAAAANLLKKPQNIKNSVKFRDISLKCCVVVAENDPLTHSELKQILQALCLKFSNDLQSTRFLC